MEYIFSFLPPFIHPSLLFFFFFFFLFFLTLEHKDFITGSSYTYLVSFLESAISPKSHYGGESY